MKHRFEDDHQQLVEEDAVSQGLIEITKFLEDELLKWTFTDLFSVFFCFFFFLLARSIHESDNGAEDEAQNYLCNVDEEEHKDSTHVQNRVEALKARLLDLPGQQLVVFNFVN